MAITRMTIMQAASDENYRSGQDIFLINRRITDFEIDRASYTDTVTLSADVSDADQSVHHVVITVNEENSQILFSDCSCSDFHNTDRLCKHCVAVLLKYISRRHLTQSGRMTSARRNTQAGQNLIQAYVTRDLLSHPNQSAAGAIDLEPLLHLESHRLSVEFKIGAKQKYVVKDLLELTRLVRNHELFEYGKNLKFYHETEAFTEDSRPLLDFIMQRIDEYTYHFQCTQETTYSFRVLKALRSLPLSPKATDAFLDLMVGRSLKLDLHGCIYNIQVVTDEPRIAMTLAIAQPQTYKLTVENYLLITGEQNLWLLKDRILYRCSQDYARDMTTFLKEMQPLQEQGLYLSQKQMAPFCGSVLKAIAPYTELQTSDVDLSDFMPPEARFSIYLDNPADSTLTCSAYAQYDEERFSLADPINYINGYRDAAREHQVLTAIRTYFAPNSADDISGDFIIENNDHSIFIFLEQGLPHFYQLGEVFISEKMKGIRIVSSPKATVGVSINGNLLELDIRSKDLPYDELAGIINSYRKRQKFYKLKSGEFLRLEDNSLSVLSELADGLQLSDQALLQEKISLPLYRASYVDAVLTRHGSDIKTQRDRYFKSLIRDLKSVEDSDYEVPEHLKPILRDYQKTGYRWLQTIAHLGFGGILADDMGLGKTLQIITLLAAAKNETPGTVSLIICPSSLVYNWDSEIERFAPELHTLPVTGTAEERHEKLRNYHHYDVLITSYDMLKRDVDAYSDLSFHYQIIDEAQFIKNHHTQAARSVRQIHSVTRFALTGTPIENRLSELWSIFEYLMPGFLYPYPYFRSEIEQPIVESQDAISANRLKQMIKPFIMRRLKNDVLKELPDKLENAVYSRMTDEQQRLYDASALQLQQGLASQSDASFNSSKIQVLAELTKLRQLCCDPLLIYENYKGGSAKLDTCIQLIQNAMAGGHKVLLFSQFTSMLDIVERRLKAEHILCYRLDGSTKSERRTQLVNDFNQNAVPVFMISLKAGGTGLNLTGADIVIHYDPWWNVAAQNQATDRAHRIGQTRTVTVYKLIARHTIEEKILKLQEAKRELADQILSGEGISTAGLTREDLLNMLQ